MSSRFVFTTSESESEASTPTDPQSPTIISSDPETDPSEAPRLSETNPPMKDPYFPNGPMPQMPMPSGEGTSRAPRLYRGARISVRPPPPPVNIRVEPAPKRPRFAEEGHWGWMPRKLSEWRFIGGLEHSPDFGLATKPTSFISLTQEPIHVTVPTIVSQLAHVEQRVERLEPALSSASVWEAMHAKMCRMEDEMKKCMTRTEKNQDVIQHLMEKLRETNGELEECKYGMHVMDVTMDCRDREIEKLEKEVREHKETLKALKAVLGTHVRD